MELSFKLTKEVLLKASVKDNLNNNFFRADESNIPSGTMEQKLRLKLFRQANIGFAIQAAFICGILNRPTAKQLFGAAVMFKTAHTNLRTAEEL